MRTVASSARSPLLFTCRCRAESTSTFSDWIHETKGGESMKSFARQVLVLALVSLLFTAQAGIGTSPLAIGPIF